MRDSFSRDDRRDGANSRATEHQWHVDKASSLPETAATADFDIPEYVRVDRDVPKPSHRGARVKVVVFVALLMFVASFAIGLVVQRTPSTQVGSQIVDHNVTLVPGAPVPIDSAPINGSSVDSAPNAPVPSDPIPDNAGPVPDNPGPIDNLPIEDAALDPSLSDLDAADSDSIDSAPFDPGPADASPIDPAPWAPGPIESVPVTDDRPILAVVIDDWGYQWEAADDFLAFQHPLTIAVLPYLPRSEFHAQNGYDAGHQVILHLPMEPMDAGWDIGPRGVKTVLAEDVIQREVREAIASIPHVSGVNNHMGSKATADQRVMESVLDAVWNEGLFFLDSFTTPDSVVSYVAEKMDIPHLVNDVFIDSDKEWENVYDRLILSAKIAKRCGYAVAIGHVRPETFKGLTEALPVIEAEGVRLGYLWEVLDMEKRPCR